MNNAVTILTTCGSEETALTIAAAVVDQGFAACVNILPRSKVIITTRAARTSMKR